MRSPAEFVSVPWKGWFLAFIVALIGLALGSGCKGDKSVFMELEQSRQLIANLRVQFNKAADASNRAVMADTDEASIAFARDAEQTSKRIENDVVALAGLLRSRQLPKEIRLLEEFNNHFSEYLSLDRNILGLAVENTNLKAQRLSFGPLREVANRFQNSLESIAGTVASKDRCRVDGLVAKAMLAVREIQALHGPHIAEREDAAMTRIERDLDRLQVTADNAVAELSKLIDTTAAEQIALAKKELDQFKEISRQIVVLSRRNSNVRSLDLALRTRLPLTAACDDGLRVLQDALSNEGSKATR